LSPSMDLTLRSSFIFEAVVLFDLNPKHWTLLPP
jgi:hypothetical protein